MTCYSFYGSDDALDRLHRDARKRALKLREDDITHAELIEVERKFFTPEKSEEL